MERLSRKPFAALGSSRIIQTMPLGPSRRRYANAAILVETHLDPPELLERLQKLESKAGRHRRCRPWAARTLDLDIILWSGGMWASDDLIIPHRAFRERAFVLVPLAQIARNWRDPLAHLTMGQLLTRHKKPRALHQAG